MMQDIESKRKMKAKEAMKMDKSMKPMTEPYVWLPNITLDADEVPDVKKCEVGKECMMMVKARMTGYREEKSLRPGRSTARGDFDIIGVEMMDDKKSKEC